MEPCTAMRSSYRGARPARTGERDPQVPGSAIGRRVVCRPELMALSTFAGGRLWGARYGTGGPWVLALHGWGRDHHDFDQVLDGLDAVALDLPGFGAAPEPPGPWSTLEYAEWVAPVLDELASGPVVVVGHSMGGRVAVQLARAAEGATGRQGRIGALVLTGAPLAPSPGERRSRPSLAYRAGRALHRARLVSDERMEQLRRKHGSSDYRNASPTMRGVLVKAVNETASAAYIPPLRAWAGAGNPVELVWGEDDKVAPLAGVRERLEGVASVQVTVVPGAGHLIGPQLASEARAAILRQRAEATNKPVL
jgi:pimeloyl-ACP methyl ester carboxylesterase